MHWDCFTHKLKISRTDKKSIHLICLIWFLHFLLSTSMVFSIFHMMMLLHYHHDVLPVAADLLFIDLHSVQGRMVLPRLSSRKPSHHHCAHFAPSLASVEGNASDTSGWFRVTRLQAAANQICQQKTEPAVWFPMMFSLGSVSVLCTVSLSFTVIKISPS